MPYGYLKRGEVGFDAVLVMSWKCCRYQSHLSKYYHLPFEL